MIRSLFDQMEQMEDEIATALMPSPRAKYLPRDYQGSAIRNSFSAWDEGHIGCLARSPTGSGKTVIGALTADLWLQRGADHRVLVLAHERQLIQQFADDILDVLGIRPAVEMGDLHCTGDEQIIVGSRQTLYVNGNGDDAVSRLFKFRPDLKWLLLIDEAHRWRLGMPSAKHIFEWFAQNPAHRRLGLTATPERSDRIGLVGTDPKKSLFTAVSSDYRLFDVDGGPCAVNDGWAVPYDQRFIVVDGVDFKNLKEVAKDFDKNELERILGETETLSKLCDPLLDIVGRRRTIIFNPGTAMARDVALYINSKMGYEAAVTVDGSYPDEQRKEIYKRHQRGDVQFLSVCGLCREGYNDPGIQCVAVFRPTKSRSLAEQMKGRGCRPLRGVVSTEMSPEERRRAIAESDKPFCLVVDLVGVSGLGDVPSTASLMAEGKPDEVIQRANAAMLATPPGEACDVAKAIRKAEADIAAETKLRREQELAKRQAEMDRRATLQAKARYRENKVRSGEGGSHVASRMHVETTTEKQANYLVHFCGFDRMAAVRMSKSQAGVIIGKHKAGKWESKQHQPATVQAFQPCNENQARVLAKFGLPTNVTYDQAADYMKRISNKEFKPVQQGQS